MDLMACKLFQAIDRGYRLRLANLQGRRASGIFIPRRWELSRSMHVWTTWQPPQKGLNEAGNAVSLKIGMGADRVARPTRSINGMVFFFTNESEDVIISWPLSWTRQADELKYAIPFHITEVLTMARASGNQDEVFG
jgi:hypothetical protein